MVKAKLSRKALGYLGAITGGILSYLALDTGSAAEKIVGDFLSSKAWQDFLISLALTSTALIGTWLALSSLERREGKHAEDSQLPLIVALGLGVHNVGEGFAIASALLSGAISSAFAFTVGFAVHNATEGIAIASPSVLTRSRWAGIRRVLGLSLLAGLPTMLGASIYYLGVNSPHFLAFLYTVASASLVFVMVKINMVSAGLLGGFREKFWTWLFLGVALAYGLESLMTILGTL